MPMLPYLLPSGRTERATFSRFSNTARSNVHKNISRKNDHALQHHAAGAKIKKSRSKAGSRDRTWTGASIMLTDDLFHIYHVIPAAELVTAFVELTVLNITQMRMELLAV